MSYLSLNHFSILILLSLFCMISYIRQFWLIDYFFVLHFPNRCLSPYFLNIYTWHHWVHMPPPKLLCCPLNLGPPLIPKLQVPLNLRPLAILDPHINICVRPRNTCVALKEFNLLPPNTSFWRNFIYYFLTHRFEAIALGWINIGVHWSINPPSLKNTTLLFLVKTSPPLKSANCPSPFF